MVHDAEVCVNYCRALLTNETAPTNNQLRLRGHIVNTNKSL